MQNVVKLLDNKLTIHMRDNSQFWHARFSHKRVIYQKSMKTTDIAVAKSAAVKWYHQKQVELESGIVPTLSKTRFESVAAEAIRAYKASRRSQYYVAGIEKVLDNIILPFMGKMDITEVSNKTWAAFKRHVESRKVFKTTLHQYQNAIKVVLNYAYNNDIIKHIPRFMNDVRLTSDNQPRTWFEPEDYKLLVEGAKANVERLSKTRWHADAQELLDYIEFTANCGLRVGEMKNLTFRNIEMISSEHEDNPVETDDDLFQPASYLLIKNIKGKRGTGECRANYQATPAFIRIWERRLGLGEGSDYHKSDELLFVKYHRNMFRNLLIKLGLRYTQDSPRRRRDLNSLRHTYICNRILADVPIYWIVRNTRTSVQMIENHYARYLSARMMNVNKYVR